MNAYKNILLITIIFFTTQVIFAQDDPKAPEPPEPPEFEFDFDFERFHQLSEEDEKELLKNLNKILKDELKVIKNFNKQKYFELLRESQFKHMKLPFMEKHEKVMHERERTIFELEVKAEALAAKYEMANETDKTSIKNKLRNELSQLFDEKEKRRKEEIQILENQLKDLQKSLAARQKNKEVIIDRRIQDLLDEEQYLDWE